MLCLKHRKSLKGRKPKKIISLPSVKKNTRQKSLLAEYQKKTLGILCRVSNKKRSERILYRVFFLPSFFRTALGKEGYTRQRCHLR